MKPTISPVGDCAISIDFGQVIDPKINRHIRQTIERIQALQLDGIIELVPTYCALLVQYDAMLYSYADMCNIIEPTLSESVTNNDNETVTVIEIPTVYGGEFGPDLGFSVYVRLYSWFYLFRWHGPTYSNASFILAKDLDSCRLCRHCRGTNWYLSI